MSAFPPLRVRSPSVIAASVFLTVVVLLVFKLPFLGVSIRHFTVPYEVPPAEYLPVMLALFLAIYLAPTFTLWEFMGSSRIARQAVVCALTVIFLPALVSALSYVNYPRDGQPPLGVVLHFALNVIALDTIVYLCVSYLGRYWGSLCFFALYYGMLLLAAESPRLAILTPRTVHRIDGDITAQVLWWWLVPLIIAALWTAYYRRSLTPSWIEPVR